MKIIKAFDIFGNDFKLNIGGSQTHNTLLGGISSISLFIATLILTWYFGQDIYKRSNPNFLKKTEIRDEVPMITLNNSDFFFAFKVVDTIGDTTNYEKYFQNILEYRYSSYDKYSGISKVLNHTYYTLEKCNTNHIDNKTLIDNALYGYYCANFSDFKYGGDFASNYVSYFEFIVRKCNKYTTLENNITCASDKEFQMFTQGRKFFIKYFIYDKDLDPTNFEKPLKNTASFRFQNLDFNNLTANYRYYYKISDLYMDTGLFFEDSAKQEFLSQDYYTSTTLTNRDYNVQNIPICAFTFYLSKTHDKIFLYYIKIPDIAALVGGTLSLFVPLLDFFLKIFIDN